MPFGPAFPQQNPSYAPQPLYHLETTGSASYVNGQAGPWKSIGGWYSKEVLCSVLQTLKNWPNNSIYRIWQKSAPLWDAHLVKLTQFYDATYGTALMWLEEWCPQSLNLNFAVSGQPHVGQTFAPYAGPGWTYNRFAPYAGPGYHYVPSALPAVPSGGAGVPPTPLLPPCPPGYEWTPAGVYDYWSQDPGGFWSSVEKYFLGGCCPSDWQYSPIQGGCIPPINTPPVYNPCQPGWNYNAAAKKCCPPGWHYSVDFQQCVPDGSPKGY